MDFVAFLVPKLRPNFRKLITEIPSATVGIRKYLEFFGINLEPETLESQSRALKTGILA